MVTTRTTKRKKKYKETTKNPPTTTTKNSHHYWSRQQSQHWTQKPTTADLAGLETHHADLQLNRATTPISTSGIGEQIWVLCGKDGGYSQKFLWVFATVENSTTLATVWWICGLEFWYRFEIRLMITVELHWLSGLQ